MEMALILITLMRPTQQAAACVFGLQLFRVLSTYFRSTTEEEDAVDWSVCPLKHTSGSTHISINSLQMLGDDNLHPG